MSHRSEFADVVEGRDVKPSARCWTRPAGVTRLKLGLFEGPPGDVRLVDVTLGSLGSTVRIV